MLVLTVVAMAGGGLATRPDCEADTWLPEGVEPPPCSDSLAYDGSRIPDCPELLANRSSFLHRHQHDCSRFWECSPQGACLLQCATCPGTAQCEDAGGNMQDRLWFDCRFQYPDGPVCDWPSEAEYGICNQFTTNSAPPTTPTTTLATTKPTTLPTTTPTTLPTTTPTTLPPVSTTDPGCGEILVDLQCDLNEDNIITRLHDLSVGECQGRCGATADCRWWTWHGAGPGAARAWCYLLRHCHNTQTCQGCISGSVTAPPVDQCSVSTDIYL